jgi:hypothetical protein
MASVIGKEGFPPFLIGSSSKLPSVSTLYTIGSCRRNIVCRIA